MLKRPFRSLCMGALSAVMLAACGNAGGGTSSQATVGQSASAPTEAPVATNPVEPLSDSAGRNGYAMKKLAVQDPATPIDGYSLDAESRLVAVQVELSVTTAEEKMSVDSVYATVTGDDQTEYPAATQAVKDELAVSEIGKGGKVTGWIAFSVPKDAKLKTIIYRVGLAEVVVLAANLAP